MTIPSLPSESSPSKQSEESIIVEQLPVYEDKVADGPPEPSSVTSSDSEHIIEEVLIITKVETPKTEKEQSYKAESPKVVILREQQQVFSNRTIFEEEPTSEKKLESEKKESEHSVTHFKDIKEVTPPPEVASEKPDSSLNERESVKSSHVEANIDFLEGYEIKNEESKDDTIVERPSFEPEKNGGSYFGLEEMTR